MNRALLSLLVVLPIVASAGPLDECEARYEACTDRCRAISEKDKAARRSCWRACMMEYAACLARATPSGYASAQGHGRDR